MNRNRVVRYSNLHRTRRFSRRTRRLALVVGIICVVVAAFVGFGIWEVAHDTPSVTFGADYSDSGGDLAIVSPKTAFGLREPMAYLAHIPGGPGTKHMTVTFYRRLKNGKLQYVSDHLRDVRNVDDTEFTNRYTWSDIQSYGITQPGTYVMRFSRGKTVLAQGTFKRLAK